MKGKILATLITACVLVTSQGFADSAEDPLADAAGFDGTSILSAGTETDASGATNNAAGEMSNLNGAFGASDSSNNAMSNSDSHSSYDATVPDTATSDDEDY